MGLKDDVAAAVDGILSQEWDIRDGTVVPTTESVALSGGAVRLEAAMVYADLADSTELSMQYDRRVAAKVLKSYLAVASRIITSLGGDIRSFDGDRVMGVFLGDYKNSTAAKCALKINWAFLKIIKPKLEAKYSSLANGSYKLLQCVGIDTSEVLVVRAGIRNNNDLIWVGRAPNVAAKLSGLRESPYHSFITKAVYGKLNKEAKISSTGQDMWEARKWSGVSGVEDVYRSNWMMEL